MCVSFVYGNRVDLQLELASFCKCEIADEDKL